MRFFKGIFVSILLASTASAQISVDLDFGWDDFGEYREGGEFSPLIATAIWVGSDENSNWNDTVNWFEHELPANDGSAIVFVPALFDSFEERDIIFDIAADISTLVLGDNSDLHLSSNFSPDTSLTIRDGVLGLSSETYSEVYMSPGLNVYAPGDTEWTLGYGFELEIAGPLHSSGSLYLDGGGSLTLNHDNTTTLTGEIILAGGILGVAHDQALGTAELIIPFADNPYFALTGLQAVDGNRRITNNITVEGGYLITAQDWDGENELELAGDIVFFGDTVIENYGGLLSFSGTLNEADSSVRLTATGQNTVIFDGSTQITGGIVATEGGSIVFGDDDALPMGPISNALIAEQDGYIGLIEETIGQRLAALDTFLSLFNPAVTAGTIGLDTAPDQMTPNSYAGPIDLSGFHADARIGTITFAEYTGLLTPAGADYQLGGGGGTLLLGSTLTNDTETPRGLNVVSSYDRPLTVFVNSSSNSFTGDVYVENSAVIFGNAPGTLPGDPSFILGSGGYIGHQDTTITVADFLAHFEASTNQGIIGFDSQDRQTNRLITDAIDLSRFNEVSDPEFYLGTSTWVNLGGLITLPDGASTYRFTGYKGGFLNVTSVLSGANSVIIGNGAIEATGTFNNALGEFRSGVSLDAVNTYSGGTHLQAGELVVTNTASLGTGPLTVSAYNYAYFQNDFGIPSLFPNADGLDIPNDIVLDSWLNVQTPFGINDSNLELGGTISGGGGLIKSAPGTLILSGTNSFSGGIFMNDGTLKIVSDSAAGTGAIGLHVDNYQQVIFSSDSPTISGLYTTEGEDDFMSTSGANVQLNFDTILTISPNEGDFYDFGGSIMGAGGLAINGLGFQRLSGYNSYTGGTTISGGATVQANNSNAFGSVNVVTIPAPNTANIDFFSPNPEVTLDNGNVRIGHDVELYAEINFGSGGGSIGGNGTLTFNNTLTIGTDARIEPGSSIGGLALNGPVDFAPGGKIDIELGQGDGGSIISDTLLLSSLNISATAIDPFTVFVSDENGYVAANFDPHQASTWNIIGSMGGVTHFDIQSFALLLDSGISTAAGNGFFSLAIASGIVAETSGTDNILQLNFTPVPEPSTFALLALGLALIGFQSRRRR